MNFFKVFVVLCPFVLHAQDAVFDKADPNPYQRGMAIAAQQGPKQALAYFETCHAQTGDYMCYYGLAYTLFLMREYDQSLELLRTINVVEPINEKHAGHLAILEGQVLIHQKKFADAELPLRSAVDFYQKGRSQDNLFNALVLLGNCYLRQGLLSEAERSFERANYVAIRVKVNKGHLFELRSILFYTLGKVSVAEKFGLMAFREYQQLDDVKAMSHSKAYVSLYRYEMGHVDAATEAIQEAYQICQSRDQNVPTWTRLVRAYLDRCNEPERYIEFFESRLNKEKCFVLRRFYEYALKPCS